LAAVTPQYLGITDFSRTHHLGAQLFFHCFVFGMKKYQIHYSASKHFQKLRLPAGTPQSLGITDLYRAHHLRSPVLVLFLCFWDDNISDTLLSI
jgi:hypothetical protein